MVSKGPTDILRKEHDKVLKILDNLENNINNRDINSIKRNLSILEKEFNRHSLNKEEKALFPAIEEFIPREGGPTGMMVIEHQDLVESIKRLNGLIKTNSLNEINEVGGHIIYILRQHIDKENNMLFMIADMHLNDKQKKNILKKFKSIDCKMK